MFPWFARVPTASNPADDASRLNWKHVQKRGRQVFSQSRMYIPIDENSPRDSSQNFWQKEGPLCFHPLVVRCRILHVRSAMRRLMIQLLLDSFCKGFYENFTPVGIYVSTTYRVRVVAIQITSVPRVVRFLIY